MHPPYKSTEKDNLPKHLQCIEEAGQLTLKWAQDGKMSLANIELVTSSVLLHKKFSVWLFYATDADMTNSEANGFSRQIKEQYISNLRDLQCPADYIQGVIFFADSFENVKRYAELKPVDY